MSKEQDNLLKNGERLNDKPKQNDQKRKILSAPPDREGRGDYGLSRNYGKSAVFIQSARFLQKKLKSTNTQYRNFEAWKLVNRYRSSSTCLLF